MTRTRKLRHSAQRDKGTYSIKALADEGYIVERLTQYQYRINDRLDLFPTNRKYHDVLTGERGDWQGALDICRRIIR